MVELSKQMYRGLGQGAEEPSQGNTCRMTGVFTPGLRKSFWRLWTGLLQCGINIR